MEHLSKLISKGNMKLPKTTAIFNMGAAHDCPSLNKRLCQAFIKGKCVCYAMKAEYSYRPNVLPYRRRQEKYWKQITAEEFVNQFLQINNRKRNPYQAIRLNEAGDFWSQSCVNKAEKIAKMLKPYGVKVYCYTARKDLNFSECKNIVINGSGFHKKGIRGIFVMVTDVKDKPKGYGVCCGDCRVCKRCIVGKNTVILKH